MKVAVIIGSASDAPKMEGMIKILKEYKVEIKSRALSAHRASALAEFVNECNNDA